MRHVPAVMFANLVVAAIAVAVAVADVVLVVVGAAVLGGGVREGRFGVGLVVDLKYKHDSKNQICLNNV